MAMLAEPRQRKRYNLVPRGKALYEDDSRFGTKMLEKMGWEKGKGLGAKEDGSKDFVRIRYKNDILGLGFEHRDDQWTQHEQSFNGLLKSLNNEEDNDVNMKEENGNESDGEGMPRMGFGFQDTSCKEKKKPKVEKLKEKISGISLEERSKQSKARVHYKKFTRGKDLAQYSEKDLANIFGKKAADEQKAANDFYSQLSSFQLKPEETKDEEEKDNEGVKIINTGVSVNDYFKNKMEAIKKRKNGLDSGEIEENVKSESNEEQQEEEEAINKKKKKKSKKEKKEVQLEEENDQEKEKNESRDGLMIYSNVSVTDYFKMKMQAIKNRNNGLNSEEKTVDIDLADDKEAEPEEVNKKKKKNKKELKDVENEPDNDVVVIKEKNSKKSKTKQEQETENYGEMINESEVSKKKEKKSKQTNAVDIVELSLEEDPNAKKKDKSKKKSQEEIEQPIEEIIDLTNKKSKKRKHEKSSKESTLPLGTTEGTAELDSTQEPTKKKKKDIAKQADEIIEIVESDNEDNKPLEENENSLRENKKKSKKSNENSVKESSSSSTANQTVNASDPQPSHKPHKVRRKDVSATTAFINDIQNLDLDELKKKYQAFNIYPISSFCAEKFRNISLNDFTGSILPQIEGYGLDSNLQLDVQIIKNDEERITNLWKGVLNKYVQLEKPKKTYQHYVKEVIKARKQKQKRPKLYIKTWQRKNAFQII